MIPPLPIKGGPGSERCSKFHHSESIRYANECANAFCAPVLELMFHRTRGEYLPLPPDVLHAARKLFDAKRAEYNKFWLNVDAADRYQFDKDLFLLSQGPVLYFGEMEYSGDGPAVPGLID